MIIKPDKIFAKKEIHFLFENIVYIEETIFRILLILLFSG